MPHVWALEKEESVKALGLLEKALAIVFMFTLIRKASNLP